MNEKLECRKKCPYKQPKDQRPCGEGFERKEEPCLSVVNAILDMLSDALPEDIPNLVIAEQTTQQVLAIFSLLHDVSANPLGNVINGVFVPIKPAKK